MAQPTNHPSIQYTVNTSRARQYCMRGADFVPSQYTTLAVFRCNGEDKICNFQVRTDYRNTWSTDICTHQYSITYHISTKLATQVHVFSPPAAATATLLCSSTRVGWKDDGEMNTLYYCVCSSLFAQRQNLMHDALYDRSTDSPHDRQPTSAIMPVSI